MLSSEIDLTAFRQILILPLTLAGVQGDTAVAVQDEADRINGQHGWVEQRDHLAHLGPANDPFAYGEFVYFHAYIQDFLYDSGGDGKTRRPLRLFQRATSGHLIFDLDVNASAIAPLDSAASAAGQTSRLRATLSIERMNLYLFELGVAVLAVEVTLKDPMTVEMDGVSRPLTLAHVLAMQNALRRIYPPYFIADLVKQDRSEDIPEYPAALQWSGGSARPPRRPSEWLNHVAQRRRNPIDAVWKEMLAPLTIEESVSDSGRRWRQIIDERIPSMVFVGVQQGTQLEESDFVRLCFMDNPGVGFPYAIGFVGDFEQRHCYDRFWSGGQGTRYMFSGFSAIVFGTGNPEPGDFFHNTIVQHFRRHYFQIGLLLQMQLAALLSLSHRVSEAVRERPDIGAPEFRRRMISIEEEMLAFEQRYWFSQISNQDQAREIYQKWIQQTGLDAIYSEVREQVHTANSYLDDREQAAQTSAATRLSVLATFGVIIGAALAFLGMNVLASPDFLVAFGVPKELPAAATPAGGAHAYVRLIGGHLAALFSILTVFSTAGRFLLDRYRLPLTSREAAERDQTTTWRLHRDLGWFAIGSLACTIAFALLVRLAG